MLLKHNLFKNSEKEKLISEIYSTINTLESIHSRFEYITEPDLIDSTIYELKANQIKYKYLLRQIKRLEEAL